MPQPLAALQERTIVIQAVLRLVSDMVDAETCPEFTTEGVAVWTPSANRWVWIGFFAYYRGVLQSMEANCTLPRLETYLLTCWTVCNYNQHLVQLMQTHPVQQFCQAHPVH